MFSALPGYAAGGSVSLNPPWANVVLALHGDGSDHDPVVDTKNGLVPDATHLGGVEVDTSESVFGGSSIKFPNNGGLVYASTYNPLFDFGTGDFCFRLWVRWDGDTSNFRVIIDTRDSAGSAVGFICYLNNSTGILLLYTGVGFLYVGGSAFPANQWVHLAINRRAGLMQMYQDGVIIFSGAVGNNYNAGVLSIGDFNYSYSNPSVPFSGWKDDIEVVNGQAVYSGAFTPPPAPFPDS